MRVLLWVTLGFGIAAAGYVLGYPAWMIAPAVVLAVLSVLLYRWKKRRALLGAALVCAGCLAGMGWCMGYDALYPAVARDMHEQVQTVDIRISDYSEATAYGIVADGTIRVEGKAIRLRVYLNGDTALKPGDRLRGEFRFQKTIGEVGVYLPGKGVFLLAYQKGPVIRLSGDGSRLGDYPAIWRRNLKAELDALFPEDTAPVARALLLGDTDGMDYETDTAMKVSGIRHVVAVSGLHVSIVFSVLFLLCGKRKFLTVLVCVPALLAFTAIAGFTPSVTRACIMQMLMILSLVLSREYDPPTALAFAALVMMLRNPYVITSVSFQLSVGCVAGIFLFSGKIRNYLLVEKGLGKRKGIAGLLCRWFAGSVSLTLGAMALTTPMSAVYFGTVSLIGILTNLLTLWMVTLVFYGIVLACLVGLVWVPGAIGIARATSFGIRYVVGVAKGLSKLPLSAVYTSSVYIVAWLIFCYILLVLFLVAPKKRPAVLICCMALGLCCGVLASWLEPLTYDCAVTVLDVGQGQCILLQSRGQNYLVDCGGDSDEAAADLAAEKLLGMGVSRLDGLFLTHYDRDHAGGVDKLLTRIDTDLLFLPAGEDETRDWDAIAGESRCVRVEELTDLTCGSVKLTVYPPALKNSGNDSSLAVLFQTESCAILITGDRSSFGERRLIAQGIPDVDVLVVGHHGSASSTCPELLEAARPEIALISVSADNSYGHPAQSVLDRLRAAGCTIYRTDQCGTIVVRR